MPVSGKTIRRRIRSVANTRKITKAMEMVSASKMRRATERVVSSRPYARVAWETIQRLTAQGEQRLHPLLVSRQEIKQVGVVLLSSNRGLCGGFNANVAQKALQLIKQQRSEAIISCLTLGKKGRDYIRHRGAQVTADFPKADVTTDTKDILPLARLLVQDFLAGKFDAVYLVYTDYVSSLRQIPRVKQLLPLETTTPDEQLGNVSGESVAASQSNGTEYIFEPSVQEVLDEMVPRLLEVQVYQAVLESEASEHSARMLAMRNASQAAEDMIGELQLAYNQQRQAAITRELAEITAGASAL